VLSRSRSRVFGGLVRSNDIRDIVRKLKRGEIVWMAPDQDFGPRRSVFAPFMGVPTATLNVIARIAQLADVPAVPFYSERLPGTQGYLLRIGQMFENFPSGDEVADATRINQAIEEQVRRTPEQYLWAHRRFKTRPPGEAEVYPPRRDRSLVRRGDATW
jgi:KDO2-lipid IV(A) lauroyltransferase